MGEYIVKLYKALNGEIRVHDRGIEIINASRNESLTYDEIVKLDFLKGSNEEDGILDIYTKNHGNMRLRFAKKDNDLFLKVKNNLMHRINGNKFILKERIITINYHVNPNAIMWIAVFAFIIGVLVLPILFGISGGDITLSEFNKLQSGMSYEEAVKIIGSKGEVMSESNLLGIHTIMYSWSGGGSAGANAIIMFQNDRVISKTQIGLRGLPKTSA